LLERIHYLLVAGFDVYGSVSHQLKTRLYMDFLRMEAEANFITFLPKAERRIVHEHWYRDTNSQLKDYIFSDNFDNLPESGITYKTAMPKQELFNLLAEHTQNSQINTYNIKEAISKNINARIDDRLLSKQHKSLAKLNALVGSAVTLLPQVSYLLVKDSQGDKFYSLINNSAHSNVAHLFSEDNRRLPEEDNLSVLRGIVGTYPNAFFEVNTDDLALFVNTLEQLKTEQDYRQLKDQFGIRRTHQNFWAFTDKLHAWYREYQTDSAGLLDFNRLENR
jgi:hypothetical protein